jgi:hypothetical protein
MEQTLNPTFSAHQAPASGSQPASLEIPTYVFAVVFSSLCVITGLIWDICWHLSIGRDGLFSPPHLVIYVGAVVSGLFSGFEVLRNTFGASTHEKQKRVRIWGFFYSSLGALFCIWGALMMLTSAPFDDWWHNTYGLDVQILSPPHTVLALGIIGVQFGAIVGVLAIKNQTATLFRGTEKSLRLRNRVLYVLFALSAGFLLTMWYTLLSEEIDRYRSHTSAYYQVSAAAFPFLLIAFGRAFAGKWTITFVTLVYTLILLLTFWIIPLFSAEPKLGPILHHIDHYQGFQFPLLLIVPAVLMDLARSRFSGMNDWKLCLILGFVFLLSFFVVQWIFGAFLLESPYARNWFFGSNYWYFGNSPDWEYRYKFAPRNTESLASLATGLGLALLFSLISARIGLLWGNWMKSIQR